MSVPSVMLFHARYNTPTAAVSRKVAMNVPSILPLVPWSKIDQHSYRKNRVKSAKIGKLTLQTTFPSKKYANWLSTNKIPERT